MYWKAKHIETNGETFITYKFFKIVNKSVMSGTYYDPVMKQIKFPVKHDLVVEERLAKSEAEFIVWFKNNIRY